jgi:hypothetical protein
MTFEDGTDRLSRIVGKTTNLRCVKSQKTVDLIYTATEALNHTPYNTLKVTKALVMYVCVCVFVYLKLFILKVDYWDLCSSGILLGVLWQLLTDVLEQRVGLTFKGQRVQAFPAGALGPWRWDRYVVPKRR